MDEKSQIKQILKKAKAYEDVGSFSFGFGLVTAIFVLVMLNLTNLKGYFSWSKPKSSPVESTIEQSKQVADLTQLPEVPQLYVKDDRLYSPFTPAKYRVQPGDSTWQIATKVYASGENYRDIEQANNLALNASLSTDQELILPDVPSILSLEEYRILFPDELIEGVIPTPAPTPLTNNLNGKKIHVVTRSQGLWQVAEVYYKDGNQYLKIYEANKDKMRSPEDIREGMELVIP